MPFNKENKPKQMNQSTGAAEYIDYISAEGKDSSNERPGYDTKQSDGEALVKLEIWGMRSTPLLPSISGSLKLEVVASDRVLFMGQTEVNSILTLDWIVWNRTV